MIARGGKEPGRREGKAHSPWGWLKQHFDQERRKKRGENENPEGRGGCSWELEKGKRRFIPNRGKFRTKRRTAKSIGFHPLSRKEERELNRQEAEMEHCW